MTVLTGGSSTRTPLRSTLTWAGRSRLARISLDTSSQSCTGTPLNASTLSPAWMPESTAGVGGLPVQLLSVALAATMHSCTRLMVICER